MSLLSAIIASNKDKAESIRMREVLFSSLFDLKDSKHVSFAVCCCAAWGESISPLLRAPEWLVLGVNAELCY